MKITHPKFYEEHEDLYGILTDFIHEEHGQIPILDTSPEVTMDIYLDDCYISEADEGLYVPTHYKLTYRGSNQYDDPDEYEPVYADEPTLTKHQITEKVGLAENPELADPMRNIGEDE